MRTNDLLLFYILLIAPISIALFLYGFFPAGYHADTIASRKDIPQYVENVRWVNLTFVISIRYNIRFIIYLLYLISYVYFGYKIH